MITPINYYGSKFNMLPYIIPKIPPHRVYIEPFFGGGTVFFAKLKSHCEVINDINDNVVNFFRVLQTNFAALARLIEYSCNSRSMHKQTKIIYKNPSQYDEITRAWAFWYQSNVSFGNKVCNGGWAYGWNSNDNSHQGRVFANRKKRVVLELAKRMEDVQIECADAIGLIKKSIHKDDIFFYLDPPYISADMGHYKNTFSKEDFQELLKLLSTAGAKFLLSSYKENILLEYRNKYDWNYFEIQQKVSIANKYKSKKSKIECLTWNYKAPEQISLKFYK
ncbi:DNA adenine methylase [Candidatus Dependentiae bacterium]|nr:DNA adenine methylase [Candidatus Dependentiae bacterium]